MSPRQSEASAAEPSVAPAGGTLSKLSSTAAGRLGCRIEGRRSVGFAALVGALALVAGAGGATAPLPGGTSLDVAVASPTDGSTLPSAPFAVTGTAAVETGAPVADTTLVYVVDVSGSRRVRQASRQVPAAERLSLSGGHDARLRAARDPRLDTAAIATGTVSKIGMVTFAGTNSDSFPSHITSAATLDLDPLGPSRACSRRTPTPSPRRRNRNGLSPRRSRLHRPVGVSRLGHHRELRPARRSGAAQRLHALQRARRRIVDDSQPRSTAERAARAGPDRANVVVASLSDGIPNRGWPGRLHERVQRAADHGPDHRHVRRRHAAVRHCGAVAVRVARADRMHFGKRCQVLTDASDAVDLVPGVVASTLSSVSVSVDSGPATRWPRSRHHIDSTVRRRCRDVPDPAASPRDRPDLRHRGQTTAAGSGTSTDCVNVTVKAPPTVAVGDGSGNARTTDEGTAFPIAASASDGTTS